MPILTNKPSGSALPDVVAVQALHFDRLSGTPVRSQELTALDVEGFVELIECCLPATRRTAVILAALLAEKAMWRHSVSCATRGVTHEHWLVLREIRR